MLILAVILSTFSYFSVRWMAHRELQFFPVIIAGVYMGTRVDGHFVPDILAAGWIALCLGVGISFLTWFVKREMQYRWSA